MLVIEEKGIVIRSKWLAVIFTIKRSLIMSENELWGRMNSALNNTYVINRLDMKNQLMKEMLNTSVTGLLKIMKHL